MYRGHIIDRMLGFILDKSIGVNCPKRLENAKILIANTCAQIPRLTASDVP